MGERKRMTNPPDTGLGTDKPVVGKGNTTMAQGENQHPVPRMPHERDESADSETAGEPSQQRVGKAGQEALDRGEVDTDKGPALDATYDKVREGTSSPGKKFRP